MWVFTVHGMVSIVQKPGDAENGMLTVRSRNHRALATFCEQAEVDKKEIVGKEAWPSDYPYRVRAPHGIVARWASERVLDIDYSNFKNAAKDIGGALYEAALHKVWVACLPLTPPKIRKLQYDAQSRVWNQSRAAMQADCTHRHTGVDNDGVRYCTDCFADA